jgi:3-oxoadipate enol-lactonase
VQVDTPGATLYVETAGQGPPLLSVSGSGSALNELTAPAASPLSSAFTVAGYDHRGLGRSSSDDRELSMADFAADGFAVADALGWEQFALFGVSFGGMVAQEMAVTHPSRITRLALACTSSGGAGGSSFPLHERPSPEQWPDLVDTRPEVARQLAALLAKNDVPAEPGYTRQLEARRRHDVWDRLGQITAPTLVTSGAFDGIAPPGNGQAITRQIPGARHALFEGGHAFLYQDPRAWPVISDFLQSTDR